MTNTLNGNVVRELIFIFSSLSLLQLRPCVGENFLHLVLPPLSLPPRFLGSPRSKVVKREGKIDLESRDSRKTLNSGAKLKGLSNEGKY